MSESPSQPRTKRQRIDKNGRFAALERLRGLKGSGSKNKCEVSDEVDNVYDTVDEKEYAKRVLSRADEDWIEDDGTGYVEDGREIFDDDDDEDDYEEKTKSSKKNKKNESRKRLRDINGPVKEKSSIKSLFSKAVPKKDANMVKLDEDDILADILGELDTKKDNTNKKKEEEILAKEYMKNFSRNIKKASGQKMQNQSTDDDKLLNELMKPQAKSVPVATSSAQSTSYSSSKDSNSTSITNTIAKKVPIPETVAEEYIRIDDNNSPIENVTNDMVAEKANESQIKTPVEDTEIDIHMFDDEMSLDGIKPEVSNTSKQNLDQTDIANFDDLLTDWENTINIDAEQITDTVNINDESSFDDGTIKFWLWEAWEDSNKCPGQLFLFGKVACENKSNEYRSACVHIENVERCLYLLPNEYIMDLRTKQPTKTKVTIMDVYTEFDETILKPMNIDKFKSKKVTKNFAFTVPNVIIPASSEYLEVRYDGKKPAPDIRKPLKSIAHIFGSNTSMLETFILDCKIKGPCWLTIKNYKIKERGLSWCKLEIACIDKSSISIADEKKSSPPPLVVAALNVRTAVNPRTSKNEVVMIACLVNNRFFVDKPPENPPFQRHFCGFSRPQTQNWPLDLPGKLAQFKATKTTKLDSERALLSWFLATLKQIDPDLIVTHDAKDCQLDVIVDRIQSNNVPMWSRVGRLQLSKASDIRDLVDFYIGRMICDIRESSAELINLRSYDLNTLCTDFLKIKEGQRMDVSNDELYAMYESGEGILKLITLTLQDCLFTLKLMCELNVLPLALQISNICGNMMNVTLQSGRNKRNEYLLLHAFTEKNHIVPDRRIKGNKWEKQDQSEGPKKKAKFVGGLVLEPIKGFYEKFILLMDFNSLYPSIIQEYNICFTTIAKPEKDDEQPQLPDASEEQGLLPRQIRRLVESRREVKKLMNNPDLDNETRMQYHIRQMALKLTANSMYGCLGYWNSRFPAQHLAALVTLKGREILMHTKSLVQNINYEVIYGDTDSIMINTNCLDYDQVYKIGFSIKQAVNKIYRQVELDIDGVFKNLLLLKKKKYAALKVTRTKKNELVYTQEQKGLDMVRRDWAPIAKITSQHVLDELFTDLSLDERLANIHNHLENVRLEIVEDRVPLPLYVITKQINKDLKHYQNDKSMPHIQVAKRMNATRNKRFKAGDMVEYIICEDGTDNAAMLRGYHIDEIRSKDNLIVDILYYLQNQVHPVVMRLCEVVQGTDAARIADCLGLDTSKYKAAVLRAQRQQNEDLVGESIIKTNVEKYRNFERFTFKCPDCKTENLIASALKRHENELIPVLEKCANAECSTLLYQHINAIKNELILTIRKHVARFYRNLMMCDESACGKTTRVISHVIVNSRPLCLSCETGYLSRLYTESDLYTQISYYQYMFDLSKYENEQIKISTECTAAYTVLHETVSNWLANSDYRILRLSKLFGSIPTNEDKIKVDVERNDYNLY